MRSGFLWRCEQWNKETRGGERDFVTHVHANRPPCTPVLQGDIIIRKGK